MNLKKNQLLPVFLGTVFNVFYAIERTADSPVSLVSEYTAASEVDTLKFTANIVLAVPFTSNKSLAILGLGYTLRAPLMLLLMFQE